MLQWRVSRVYRCAVAMLVPALAAACGAGGEENGGTDPSQQEPLSASISASTLLLGATQTKTLVVTVTRPEYNNGSGAVTLGLQNLPAGVTATFNPSAVTGRTSTSTLTLAAAPDAKPFRGDVFLAVTAAGRGAGFASGAPPSFELTIIQPQVTVTRAGPGSGTVTSDPTGINCGSVCTAGFAATPLTLTATPATGSTFAGWSGGCVASTPTCTFTPTSTGNAANSVTATFTAPSFSLAVVPTSMSIQQGASGTATVDITRVGGFAGAVNLFFTGVPGGLTITPTTSSITGQSVTVTIAAAPSLGAGNYPITINATSPGITSQSVTLPVQVTPSSNGNGSVSVSFASCDPTQVPIWFAVQDGNGAWTRVPAGGNSTFTFRITSAGGVAYVTGSGSSYTTTILFVNASDALSIATGSICDAAAQTGTRTLTTNAVNIGSQHVEVALGGASVAFDDPAPPTGGHRFTLNNFPAGRRDLIGARSIIQANGLTQLQRVVMRRNTAYSANAFPPSIDFSGPESFAPQLHFVTLGNLAGDKSSVTESFTTTNGSSADFFESVGTFSPAAGADFVPFYAVPDSALLPGDFHALFVAAAPQNDNTRGRIGFLLLHSSPNSIAANVPLGPPLATPTVSSLTTGPALRMRAQLASQTTYNAAAIADFSQNDISVSVALTAGYSQGAPPTWTMDIPDLSSAGYDPTWGLKNGPPVGWQVVALGGSVLPLLGGVPVDGAQVVGGIVTSPSGSLQVSRPIRPRFPIAR